MRPWQFTSESAFWKTLFACFFFTLPHRDELRQIPQPVVFAHLMCRYHIVVWQLMQSKLRLTHKSKQKETIRMSHDSIAYTLWPSDVIRRVLIVSSVLKKKPIKETFNSLISERSWIYKFEYFSGAKSIKFLQQRNRKRWKLLGTNPSFSSKEKQVKTGFDVNKMSQIHHEARKTHFPRDADKNRAIIRFLLLRKKNNFILSFRRVVSEDDRKMSWDDVTWIIYRYLRTAGDKRLNVF